MLNNKIAGCFFGYAVGDALGLGTEFMTRNEAKRRYEGGLRDYSHIIRDAHRSLWKKGDFTADTDFILELAESIADCNGIDHLDYARRLHKWSHTKNGTDLGHHLLNIISDNTYPENPYAVAENFYNRIPEKEAHNESLGRAMIAGFWPSDVEKNVTGNCRLTHAESRCVASSVIIGIMANELLWHRRPAPFDHLYAVGARIDRRVCPYLEKARDGELDDFELDDEDTFWYVRKTMGAALWTLWHITDPEEALYMIVDQAGDADTNAALSLGLLGLKYGFNKLPLHLVEALNGHDRIEAVVKRFVPVIQEAQLKDTDEFQV